MMLTIRSWLNKLKLPDDPIQREQAPMLQTLIIVLIIISVISIILTINALGFLVIQFLVLSAWFLVFSIALVLIRRGYYLASLNSVSLILMIGLFALFVPQGIRTFGTNYTLITFPIVLAGLVGTRRMMWIVVGCAIILFTIIGYLGDTATTLVGYQSSALEFNFSLIITFGLVVFLPAIVIDRFSDKLRIALFRGLQREKDLEEIREKQEMIIAERTAHLQRALAEVEQREQALNHTLEALQRSQESVRKLSVPVLPVLPQVLAVPLIGDLDQERAETLMNNTLAAVIRERTRYIISGLLQNLADRFPTP